MYQVREVLRLYFDLEKSKNQISTSLNLSFSTVSIIINRAKDNNLDYKTAKELSDSRLNDLIYPNKPGKKSDIKKIHPDYEYIVSELKKKKMTKTLLYREYQEKYEDKSFSFSTFCLYLRQYVKGNSLSMVLDHKPGEKTFVDYCGTTVPIYNIDTDEVEFLAQIFVATLPYSEYTYFEAHESQAARWFINGLIRTFDFIDGVTNSLVTDNLKASVISHNRGDIKLSKAMIEFAQYYSIAVEPARPYKPKDKAKVESRVGYIERNVLNALRNKRFYSLGDLNTVLYKYVELINSAKFTKKPITRKDLFATEKPYLSSLPKIAYTYGEYFTTTVPKDYHITYNNVKYSVPNELRNKVIEYKVTDKTIEIYHESKLVTITNLVQGDSLGFESVTSLEHLHDNHRAYLNADDKNLISQRAKMIGENTKKVTDVILNLPSVTSSKISANALLHLADIYSKEELEMAARKAVQIGSLTKSCVESILKSKSYLIENIEQKDLEVIDHENIRGQSYYTKAEV